MQGQCVQECGRRKKAGRAFHLFLLADPSPVPRQGLSFNLRDLAAIGLFLPQRLGSPPSVPRSSLAATLGQLLPSSVRHNLQPWHRIRRKPALRTAGDMIVANTKTTENVRKYMSRAQTLQAISNSHRIQSIPAMPHHTSDVWSSRTPSPDAASSTSPSSPPTPAARAGLIEGSEQPLLERTHYTHGYRAGISDGKDDPGIAQAGFDEGYPVGAVLGLRRGWLIECLRGVVEELVGGGGRVGARGQDVQEARTRLKDAETDLGTARLLEEMEAAACFVEGGAEDGAAGMDEHSARNWTVPSDFADQLPSIQKWSRVVEGLGMRSTPG